MVKRTMKTHKFTLILSGVADITPALADALYEATHGDIEFNMRDRVAYLEVERSAPSLREAIVSAIQQVEGADMGVRVVRVESESANIIAKINAELLGAASGGSGA
jgi:hypothetical protein